MIEKGATHVGVATDHVIESFRNELWPGYKTGDGIDPALWAQFHPLEDALAAMGVVVWPMVELEADDALASAAHSPPRTRASTRSASGRPTRISRSACAAIASCRSTARASKIRDADGVREKFGVEPALIPDLPRARRRRGRRLSGHPGIGAVTAARLLNRHGAIEDFPPEVLGDKRELALLFKTLATLRTGRAAVRRRRRAALARPDRRFAAWAAEASDQRVLARARKAAHKLPA